MIGTSTPPGALGLGDPIHPDRCNDYVAAVVRSDPERFIGFASMNHAYRGVDAAVEELRRAVTELGLAGVKLYPIYPHWAANSRPGVPPYQTAQELGIPVIEPPADRRGSTRSSSSAVRRCSTTSAAIPRPARDHRALRAAVESTRRCSCSRSTRTSTPSSRSDATLTRRDLFLLLSALRADRSSRWRSCSSAPTTRGSSTTP